MAGRERWFSLAFALLCAGCVVPLFYVRYPPIEDLPQHLAAVRVLHDFHTPGWSFDRYFELCLFDTQYLAYYIAADALAYVFDVELATRLLIAASLVCTAYAMRSLLESLGKDGYLAVLTLPLAYNAHVILGFLNFVAAIPLSLYAVVLAVCLRRQYSLRRASWLACVLLVCFYTHVVPFALACIAVVLMAIARELKLVVRSLMPLVPSAAAALFWLRMSPAGQATATAVAGADAGPKANFVPFEYALQQAPRWLTDVLAGDTDLHLLEAWLALAVLAFLLAAFEWVKRQPTRAPDELARSLSWRLWVLPPLCVTLYFVLPTGYAWIWPIAPRFALLAALWMIAVLPRFRIGREWVLIGGLVISAATFHGVGKAFAQFDREEVGDFDQALAAIPREQRVVGLIFDRYSRYVGFTPFLHSVAYYQTRKGGAVMFTFADFPQSPFRFRPELRPPRVPPRWEWLPERVRPTELGFYDYALVRGGPGPIGRPSSGFESVYRGARWSVFRRMR